MNCNIDGIIIFNTNISAWTTIDTSDVSFRGGRYAWLLKDTLVRNTENEF